MQKNQIISEVPQEDDFSSISHNSNADYDYEQNYKYQKNGQIFQLDEDESFDEDEYEQIKSKGIIIKQQKENNSLIQNKKKQTDNPQGQKTAIPQKSILKPILRQKTEVLVDKTNKVSQPVTERKQSNTTSIIDFKPIYTTPISQQMQKTKQFNYKSKSFNTLVKKSDRVARFQQMSQTWNKTKFLQNNSGKEGRKLNLEERIKNQKQQQREEGIFYKYVNKSELFQ